MKSAVEALRDGLPEVAMVKLERLLADKKLAPEVWEMVRRKLAESGVKAGKWERVLELTQGVKPAVDGELAFWRAVALQLGGRWTEALEVYAVLPMDATSAWFREAIYNHVATLSALGEYAEAQQVLEPLLEEGREARPKLWLAELLLRQKRLSEAEAALGSVKGLTEWEQDEQEFLLGRLRLEQGDAADAVSHLEPLTLVGMTMPRALHQGALLLLARAQRLAGEQKAAVGSLAMLVSEAPDGEMLSATFQEIQLCNVPVDGELMKLLIGWTASTHPQTNAEATLALVTAKEANGELTEGLRLCSEFISAQPQNPLLPAVMLRQSRLLIQLGQVEKALLMLKPLQQPTQSASVRSYAAAVLAYAQVKAGDFHKAAEAFQVQAANAVDPEQKLVAMYQAALASVSAEEPEVGNALLASLPDKSAKLLRADFLLERGLYAAAKGSPQAGELLGKFLDRHADHPRAFAAALALAELSLQDVMSAPQTVREKIALAHDQAKTPEDQQRVEILLLHLESLNATPEDFAKKADQFLEAHPESVLRADLLMKLAVRFYNHQKYAPAKVRFLQLVEEEPESSLVETSLYWAGKAALGSLAQGCEDEAIKLWDRVAAGKGVMQMEAKLEQARLNQRRKPAAAMQIFDSMLKATSPLNANLRFTVLCLRGETLIGTANEDAAKFKEAMSDFEQVIQAPESSVYWKQQAYVRKGVCLENLKQEAAALEAYHEAMKLSANNLSNHESDYHWFFRAGSKAIRLLESKQNWEAAVVIAQKLAEAPGPQADAARERASRITTEHFLWQDE